MFSNYALFLIKPDLKKHLNLTPFHNHFVLIVLPISNQNQYQLQLRVGLSFSFNKLSHQHVQKSNRKAWLTKILTIQKSSKAGLGPTIFIDTYSHFLDGNLHPVTISFAVSSLIPALAELGLSQPQLLDFFYIFIT